jgi:hypothetical protein
MSPVRCSQLFQYLRVNAGIVIAGKSSFIHTKCLNILPQSPQSPPCFRFVG